MANGIDFDPIKVSEDGKKSKSVIWTSKALSIAVKGLEQGKRLVANPFYENNVKLLKGDLVFKRTDEEIKEWLKCKNDIIYFAATYCKLMTPEGIKNITLRDYQEKYLNHVSENQLSIYLSCRQSGKCVDMSTHVKLRFKDTFPFEIPDRFYRDYYITDMDCFNIPLFELYNFFDKSFNWKMKYYIYRMLWALDV